MEPVVVRDVVLGDGVPKICVPIVAHTMAQLDEAIDAIDPADCDLVEFRADFYFEDDARSFSRSGPKKRAERLRSPRMNMRQGSWPHRHISIWPISSWRGFT